MLPELDHPSFHSFRRSAVMETPHWFTRQPIEALNSALYRQNASSRRTELIVKTGSLPLFSFAFKYIQWFWVPDLIIARGSLKWTDLSSYFFTSSLFISSDCVHIPSIGAPLDKLLLHLSCVVDHDLQKYGRRWSQVNYACGNTDEYGFSTAVK